MLGIAQQLTKAFFLPHSVLFIHGLNLFELLRGKRGKKFPH